MKNIKYLLFSLFLLIPFTVNADTIYNATMDITIDKDGTANIVEQWDVKASKGSEWYKQYNNLGNIEINDYTVTMDGKLLMEKNWDINEGLNEKAGFYGINSTEDGVELCFGKSDFKRHKFILTYKMTNFVFNTEDSQVVYQTLFPKATMDNFKVTVKSFYSFPNNLDVWGYGYKGYAYVLKDQGIIEMSSEGPMDDEYVVLLIKFPKGTFETTNTYTNFNKFNDVLTLAKKGSYKHDYGDGFLSKVWDYIYFIVFGLIFIVPIIVGVIAGRSEGYGYKGNKKVTKDNSPMFRDIPCNKDIFYANALIDLNSFGYKEGNILGALLLKWIKEDKITFKNEKKGVFNKDTSTIDFTKEVTFDDTSERDVFTLMRAASGDGILEAKEMEKYCRTHYEKFFSVLRALKTDQINKLKEKNHITPRVNKEECKKKNVMDETIFEDSKKLLGLKLFLNEFSRINSKEVMEVKIWDEYLMFAYLFGIADKVSKQLKHLHPEGLQINNNDQYFDYGTLMFIDTISTKSVSAASSARAAAESYSAGGGGFASGGGGGGSFGGGGSMGGR